MANLRYYIVEFTDTNGIKKTMNILASDYKDAIEETRMLPDFGSRPWVLGLAPREINRHLHG